MKKFAIYFLTLVFLLSLNMVFPEFFGSVPNFLFLIVIFYALEKDDESFLWIAFFSGLLLDLTSHAVFGSFTLSFLLIALAINYTTRIFFTADVSILFISVMIIVSYLFLTGMLHLAGALVGSSGYLTPFLPLDYLSGKVWVDLLLNLVFALPVYALTHAIEKTIINIDNNRPGIQ